MASGIKTVLLSESGKQFYLTIVADTSSAITYDLINWELVVIDADAGGGTVVQDPILSSGIIPFPR